MGSTVGVLTKDGEYRHYPWNGFIERSDVMKMAGAIPVKLFAVAYTTSNDEWGPWIDLTPDQALQGCWHEGSVWIVVVDGAPRVVQRQVPDPWQHR